MIQIFEETSLAHIPDQPFGVIAGFISKDTKDTEAEKSIKEYIILFFTEITNFKNSKGENNFIER